MRKLFIFLIAFVLLAFTPIAAQTVNPETFPAITTKTAALGKYLYTNTNGEGKIPVDSIGKWFAPSGGVSTNLATANQTATGNRTHNWNNNSLTINNISFLDFGMQYAFFNASEQITSIGERGHNVGVGKGSPTNLTFTTIGVAGSTIDPLDKVPLGQSSFGEVEFVAPDKLPVTNPVTNNVSSLSNTLLDIYNNGSSVNNLATDDQIATGDRVHDWVGNILNINNIARGGVKNIDFSKGINGPQFGYGFLDASLTPETLRNELPNSSKIGIGLFFSYSGGDNQLSVQKNPRQGIFLNDDTKLTHNETSGLFINGVQTRLYNSNSTLTNPVEFIASSASGFNAVICQGITAEAFKANFSLSKTSIGLDSVHLVTTPPSTTAPHKQLVRRESDGRIMTILPPTIAYVFKTTSPSSPGCNIKNNFSVSVFSIKANTASLKYTIIGNKGYVFDKLIDLDTVSISGNELTIQVRDYIGVPSYKILVEDVNGRAEYEYHASDLTTQARNYDEGQPYDATGQSMTFTQRTTPSGKKIYKHYFTTTATTGTVNLTPDTCVPITDILDGKISFISGGAKNVKDLSGTSTQQPRAYLQTGDLFLNINGTPTMTNCIVTVEFTID